MRLGGRRRRFMIWWTRHGSELSAEPYTWLSGAATPSSRFRPSDPVAASTETMLSTKPLRINRACMIFHLSQFLFYNHPLILDNSSVNCTGLSFWDYTGLYCSVELIIVNLIVAVSENEEMLSLAMEWCFCLPCPCLTFFLPTYFSYVLIVCFLDRRNSKRTCSLC